MKLSHILSRSGSRESLTLRKHTPWIASPLETDSSSTSDHSTLPPESKHQTHDIKFDLPHHHDSSLPPFKHHHESSTVELFYDLFFVANLATFTVNHEIVNADSLKNYIGFFTILWFTWLETSLFDVRFATDSVFNRICKAISFGVMTGFAITGAIYDTNNVGENVKAFRALALILMVSRLALIVQYGVVLFYVRNYRKTLAPLLCTMATLFVAAMIFLGTFFGYDSANTGESFPNQSSSHTYIAYYTVVCVEAAAVIAISCVWRVVSFKHTHLVERIGLLTLIIMGEGIIGMTKSVSKILQNSSSTSSSDIGVIIASVLLIYFIWVLYFDQIEHDRFGTIRQQIWAILHFPLHVAILLTVEGSTALILWNIIVNTDNTWWSYFPVEWPSDSAEPLNNFPKYFDSAEAVVDWLKEAVKVVSAHFKPDALEEEYDFNSNFTAILDQNATFGSEAWNERAGEIVLDMFVSVENFIFENFGVEVPETQERSHKGDTSDEVSKNNSLWEVFSTVFIYFYIAAGCFLAILAVMYWFGKTRKSRGEWGSIAIRSIAGAGLTFASFAQFYGSATTSFNFLESPWHIPMVMLTYFVVIILDNLLVWHTNKTIVRQTSGYGDRERKVLETDTDGERGSGSGSGAGSEDIERGDGR